MPPLRLLRLFYRTSFVLLAGLLCYLGLQTDTDTFDAYNSLLQTRRVESSSFADVAYSPVRGRTLVGLVVVLDTVVKAVTGRWPTVPEYHVFMVVIALTSVALWVRLLSVLFGPMVGLLVGCLALWDAAFLYHSIFIHSDILAGGAFASCLLLLLAFLRGPAQTSRTQMLWRGVALGVCFAVAAMTKHQFFWLGPVVLVLLVVIPAVERLRSKAPSRLLLDRTTLCGVALIAFIFVIDLSHRLLAGPEVSFASHVAMLRDQYYDYQSSWARSSPWVYVNYLKSFGVAFWGLALVGAVVAFFRRAELKASLSQLPRWRVEMISILAITTAVFAAITQKFSYRETRYLFPLVPALLAAGALALGAAFRLRGLRLVFGGLLVASVCWQIKQSRTTLLTMRDRMDPIDKVERSLFWKYLAAEETPCAQVRACRFYTYSYDYEWPQYRYLLARPATVSTCELPTENAIALRRQLSARLEPGTCYVLPSAYQNEGVPAPVTVHKTIGVHLNMEQALKAFRRGGVRSGEQVACEAFGDSFDCYLSRRFFQRPAGPLASND